jgi:transposase
MRKTAVPRPNHLTASETPTFRIPTLGNRPAGTKRQRGSAEYVPGGPPLPVALRKQIVHLFFDLDMTCSQIAPLVFSPRVHGGISVGTVYRWVNFYDAYGHVEDMGRAPRACIMLDAHLASLILIVTRKPWMYLDEISEELRGLCGVTYNPGLCYTTLKRHGYVLKVMRRKARQRDEEKRFEYFLALSDVMTSPAQLVFADEVGQDGRGSRRRRGWGPRGQDLEITEFLNRGVHISILALYGHAGFIDFDYVTGGYSAGDFLSAVEFMIIPHLRPYPENNSILILDNCGIHHTHAAELRDMVEAVGAKLLFLAPYCPIDNPIEMGFNSFKACWKRHGAWLDAAAVPLHAKIEFCLENCGSNGLSAAANYATSGYV